MDTNEAFADATNELGTANGYTANGVALATKTVSYNATGNLTTFSADDFLDGVRRRAHVPLRRGPRRHGDGRTTDQATDRGDGRHGRDARGGIDVHRRHHGVGPVHGERDLRCRPTSRDRIRFAATAGAKTFLKIVSTTGFHIKVKEIALFTDGVTATAVPATWDLFTSDETTAGTPGTAVTSQVSGRAQAHGTTVTQKHSAEGTTYTVLKSGYLPQFMGQMVIQNLLGDEEESPSDAADSIGLRVNVSANVNVLLDQVEQGVVWRSRVSAAHRTTRSTQVPQPSRCPAAWRWTT